MIDRKKVIKGLEICTSMQYRCANCPYYANCCLDGQEVMENALALLKEQEALIRCKDCKYGALMSDAITYMCESPEQENRRCVHEHDGYWFCANGERR